MHNNFAASRSWQIAGEATSDYVYWPPAMERIARYNPAMKIVISLRNPADRAFSHWNMRRVRDQEPLDFLPAIERDRATVIEPYSLNARRYAYVDRGLYFGQIERVFRFFPRDQVMLIKQEKFRADYASTIHEMFDFLGVERPSKLKNQARNEGPYQRKMTPDERRAVSAIFADDVRRLEELIGWDCRDWLPTAVAG